jgi:DNA-binding response OmpR family regulator
MTSSDPQDSGKRVLLLEDDEAITQMLSAALCKQGLSCHRSTSLTEAEATMATARAVGKPFDLLLCDDNLPDGKGTTFAVRQRNAGWRGKVLLLSANSALSHGVPFSVGIDRALQKGCSLSEITAAATELLTSVNSKEAPAGRGLPPALVERYRASLKQDRGRLAALHKSWRREEVAALAHRLCGSAALYGFAELRLAAHHCEEVASKGTKAAMTEAMTALLAALDGATR